MSTKVFEHAYYIGNYMSGILYGVELVMYFHTLRALFTKTDRRRSDRFFIGYTTLLLVLLTLDISTDAVWGENMWITDRDKPGGPPMFIATSLNVWYQILGSTAAVALVFLSDALLLYRTFVIWSSKRWIIVVPVLIYLGAFSMAVCELVEGFEPGGYFFAREAVNFGIPYYAMTISLNIILTALICGRLFYLSKWVRSAMGEENAKLYTGIMAILVESAAPYSLIGLMFLIPYGYGSDTSNAFGQVWAKVTCLAPQLIVYRVVTRSAWDRNTIHGATRTMEFALPKQATTTMSQSGVTGGSSNPYSSGTLLAMSSGTKGSGKWSSDHSLKNMAGTDV